MITYQEVSTGLGIVSLLCLVAAVLAYDRREYRLCSVLGLFSSAASVIGGCVFIFWRFVA